MPARQGRPGRKVLLAQGQGAAREVEELTVADLAEASQRMARASPVIAIATQKPSQGAGPRHLASDGDGPQAPAHGPARKCSDGFGSLLEERRLLVDLLLMAALMDTAGVAADGRIDNWHGA